MLVPILAREVMVDAVETVAPDTTARDAARRMHDRDVGSLVVVADGDPVGIVTETDLVGVLADGRDPTAVTVEAFMTAPVLTVGPDDPIEDVATRMDEADVEHLPVLADDRLVGLVSAVELADYLPRLRHRILESVEPAERVREVRTDLAYENVDWESTYRGTREDGVDVGDGVEFSKPITDRDVRRFAEATGDTNRLHLDADYAAGTRFKQPIAHGLLTAGLISAALARLPGLVIYLSQDLTFQGPVPVGERATAVCDVVDDLGGSKYRLRTVVTDADGEQVVEGTAVVLVDEMPPLPEGQHSVDGAGQ